MNISNYIQSIKSPWKNVKKQIKLEDSQGETVARGRLPRSTRPMPHSQSTASSGLSIFETAETWVI